jgi:rfaE bifunctional protein kinase chain/domain/rfaE bifunctional protein nucleotidyltransferase chain/domain
MTTAIDYTRKIQKFPALVETISRIRQGKVVALCHGVFDIVHPGHIRHLRFAKEKADILVVSITCDEMVQKKKDRPYITEDLRAENLAALELVDYVYIDYDATPIRCLKGLKPDIYIKGYEYDGRRPDAVAKTQEEMQAVSRYGGKVIFSPGDVIFSSTEILSRQRPDCGLEQLSAMCRARGVSRSEIMDTVSNLSKAKILLLGDTIIDRYHYCTTLGASTKTPTFSVKRDSAETFIGGAAVVAQNMASFGAEVRFVTLVGDDAEGQEVAGRLRQKGLIPCVVVDSTRPTTKKEVFESSGYKLLQVDEVDNTPLLGETLIRIQQGFEQQLAEAQTVVFSDFRHGLLHTANIPGFLAMAKGAGKLVVADTQVSSRWGNILDYRDADLLCATEREARFALADQDCGLIPLGRKCLVEANAKSLILKLGEKGLIAFQYPHGGNRELCPINSLARDVVDAKGAGDALLSVAAVALSIGAPLLIIALLSSCAAALSVERMGNAPIPYEELANRVKEIVDALDLSSASRVADGDPGRLERSVEESVGA